jgi:hypothetical protein
MVYLCSFVICCLGLVSSSGIVLADCFDIVKRPVSSSDWFQLPQTTLIDENLSSPEMVNFLPSVGDHGRLMRSKFE